MLAARVRAGQLPPVAERLPTHPLVLVPNHEVGRYGGTIRRALAEEVVETRGVTKTLNDGLMGYERPLARSVQLNLAESFEYSDGGKTAVVRIREGVKWSDGHPFTVNDILFWYYDVVLNSGAREMVFMEGALGWVFGGELATLEKLDLLTLKVSCKSPLGRLPVVLSQGFFALPKHFLASFHPKYAPDATYENFRERSREHLRLFSPGVPSLSAWIPVQWVRGQRIVMERNPYYWKIDSAGNQLPYADGLEFRIIQNPEVILLNFINGELDLFGRYFRDSLINMMRAEAAKGTFNLHGTVPQYSAGFYPNLDAPKAALRNAFRKRDVRIALSHAINREEINQVLYQGTLVPAGYSLAPSSPYFSEESSRMYSDFDPSKAKKLLDAAGLRDSDGDGFRELLDGSRFEVTIDSRISQSDVCELVAEQWREIGIKVNLFPALRDILGVRLATAAFDIAYWDIEGAEDPLSRKSSFAILGPKIAPIWHLNAYEEGPEWLWEATRVLHAAENAIDSDEVREHMILLRDVHTENIPIIGIGLRSTMWGSHLRLGNVPDLTTASGVYRGWSRPVMHEQLFIRE